MARIRCAVIGSGNIGADLLAKLLRSDILEPVWMVGIDPNSEGLQRAKAAGLKVTSSGVDGLVPHITEDEVKLAFDATSAYAHHENNRKMIAHGVMMIDLTPAAIGPFCIPSVNLESQMSQRCENLNMVTCGGQATIPIVAAIARVQPVEYAEIIATVASRSAGPGTRKNIDEFTTTTASAIESVGRAKKGKAIIVLNPAEPPLIMRDTVHCLVADQPQEMEIVQSVNAMICEVQRYVPGYRLINGPIFDGRRISVFLQVEGLGDFLPAYAGNLDIMTAAATRTGEVIAGKMLAGTLSFHASAVHVPSIGVA